MAEIIKQEGDEITIQFKVKLTGSMLEIEQAILAGVNESGSVATAAALTTFDTTGAAIQVANIKMTTKGKATKEYQTPYGIVVLARHVYQASKGGKTFCPLDDRARIIMHSTPKFAQMVTCKYAHASSSDVARDLEENHGRKVARHFVQNIADYVGAIAQSTEEAWDYEIPLQKDHVATISLSLDGTTILMQKEGYREAMTGNISLYNSEGNRLHTIYVGAAPEHGKALFLKRLQTEFDKIKQKYPTANYIGIADGAASNWKFLEPNVTVNILDFYHATEYLSEASLSFSSGAAKCKEWLHTACHKLKHEKNAAIDLLNEMKEQVNKNASNKKLSQAIKDNLVSAVTYFTNQIGRMNYSHYMMNNFPIGSGVTEAACKTLIKQRLCKSSMKWKTPGARVVIALRSLVQTTGRWTQFWNKINQNGLSEFVSA